MRILTSSRRSILRYTATSMGRSILAVVVAYALGAALIYGIEQVLLFALEDASAAEARPAYFYLISIAADAFSAIIAGWACAAIARKNAEGHAMIVLLLGEVTGIILALAAWKTTPHYFIYAVLILCPIALLFGVKAHVWTRPVEIPDVPQHTRH